MLVKEIKQIKHGELDVFTGGRLFQWEVTTTGNSHVPESEINVKKFCQDHLMDCKLSKSEREQTYRNTTSFITKLEMLESSYYTLSSENGVVWTYTVFKNMIFASDKIITEQ